MVLCFENLLKHLRHDNSHEAKLAHFVFKCDNEPPLLFQYLFKIYEFNLVIEIETVSLFGYQHKLLDSIHKIFQYEPIRQYTQSDDVFPIQNLLEKIGMSGGEKKRPVATNSIFIARLTDATPFGWDGTIPLILEAL